MNRRTHRHRAPRPVFVDASGRRQQGLRVAGSVGVLAAVGYVCVLVSTVLGGPTIQSALLPLPDAPSPRTVAAQHPVPTGSTTSAPTQQSIVTVAPTTAMPTAATAGPTPTSVMTTALPTSSVAATTKVTGKPTALPTQANKPTKPPR